MRTDGRGRRLSYAAVVLALVLPTWLAGPARAAGPCDTAPGSIACENTRPGTPRNLWQIPGAGDTTIQGFGTSMSVNVGETERFKIKTDAAAYRLDIYRLGNYQGNGARLVDSVAPTAPLPQEQPACLSDPASGLVDCGPWGESAAWAVPSNAVSGVYFALLTRPDTGGQSQVFFVVRNDASHSDVLYQTSDTTWEAYNQFGGSSLYTGGVVGVGRAYKVSYNRPFANASSSSQNWLFNAEAPMISFLEANGYDLSYTSGLDTDLRGALLRNHRVFMSSGHDEYWSAGQRANVEAARDAGVSLAFFTGNSAYWKMRWESSTDPSATPNRTLVSYKETRANAPIDPADPPTWTGAWRDARFSPPADGGRPENALTGLLWTVECCASDMKVAAEDGRMRFWRNTSVATLPPGTSTTLAPSTLGYEWDEDVDNGSRPAGLVHLSTTQTNVTSRITDPYGNSVGAGSATHHMSLYRASSGALVFDSGTVQWAYGLDPINPTNAAPDVRMRQATVNLLADMHAQPATLVSGLVAATAGTDTAGPTVTVNAPGSGTTLANGSAATVSGTAADVGGGVVGAVEVSVDGGSTWHPASGRESWSYNWAVSGVGAVSVMARASDDSGNLGAAVTRGVTVTCPCTVFPQAATPATASAADSHATTVGMKLRSSSDGFITGVRFYKGSGNTGTHEAYLWSATGTVLGSGTFSSESPVGWQQLDLPTPVHVTAGTTYVVGYSAPSGHYAVDNGYITAAGTSSTPLRGLADREDGRNSVFSYAALGTFPTTDSGKAPNYWVDAVFTDVLGADRTAPRVSSTVPAAGASGVDPGAPLSASFSEPVTGAALTLQQADGTGVPVTTTYDASTRTLTASPSGVLASGTTYTATVSGAQDAAGNVMDAFPWSFTVAPPAPCPCTIFPASAVPRVAAASDAKPIEVGVKFRTDVDGSITGLRFYKGASNTGTHVGNLWSSTGQLLASATFSAESAGGWQSVGFGFGVPLRAGTTYVASYHTDAGHYAADTGYFAGGPAGTSPIRALAAGTDGPNGVYVYGASAFPTTSFSSSNYWVDVTFSSSSSPPDVVPPTVASTSPSAGDTGVAPSATTSAVVSEAIDPSTGTFTVTGAGGAPVAGRVSWNGPSRTLSFQPAGDLLSATPYSATVAGYRDLSGNQLASPVSWSFTTGTPSCPCSIFSATVTPKVVAASDARSVEVGVRFRADVSGSITGIRFYKGAANTGPHTGTLWSSTGVRLASVTFPAETASGWQEATFTTPVAVTAGTTYVASYHATVGRYAVDTGYFSTSGTTRAPVRALANGVDGPDGVYAYGSTPTFPTSTAGSSNYWVDVVFTPGTP